MALVADGPVPDNDRVVRLRSYLQNDMLILVVTAGVVGSALLDWVQGSAPESRMPGVAGFGPFAICALLCMMAAVQANDVRRTQRWRTVSLVASLAAAALADPTYATLLAVIPITEIARRADEPERSLSIAVGGAFLAWLVVTEPTRQTGSEIESMLVLLIVMTVVVMFGNALRRSDQARILEARLARADERSRLARDIHDSLGHNLLASSIQLQNARALLDNDPAAASTSLDLASRAVGEALAETRLVVDDTHAEGGSFSLEASLSGLVVRSTTPEMSVSLNFEGDHRRVDASAQMALYRFAQEALANVIRHADASQALVTSIANNGTVSVSVADDGRGFDAASAPERTGLSNLRERLARHGGTVVVSSERGTGTTVTAVVEETP